MPSPNSKLTKTVFHIYKRSVFWLLVLLFTFVVSSCNDETLVDRSFITQEPCAAPCWYGLELEKSSEEDVYTVLENLPFVNYNSIKEWGTVWGDDENAKEIFYDCQHPRKKRCGGFILSNDRLKQLWVSVNYNLSFFDVVQILGPPNHISYVPRSGEIAGCTLALYWPKKSIYIRSHQREGCPALDTLKKGVKIDSDTKVTYITYIDLETFNLGTRENEFLWPGFAEE